MIGTCAFYSFSSFVFRFDGSACRNDVQFTMEQKMSLQSASLNHSKLSIKCQLPHKYEAQLFLQVGFDQELKHLT